jgi:hypothetical protein
MIPNLPRDFPRTGHVMPEFQETLLGIGPICDAGCTVLFSDTDVIIHDKKGNPILSGWREPEGAKLWYFNLLPEEEELPPPTLEPRNQATLAAFSAYDLPSVQALVQYFHAAAGFPVKDTWLRAIKNCNFESWPGLTYNNAARYCPNTDETLKGHMTQCRQGVRSTRPRGVRARPQSWSSRSLRTTSPSL